MTPSQTACVAVIVWECVCVLVITGSSSQFPWRPGLAIGCGKSGSGVAGRESVGLLSGGRFCHVIRFGRKFEPSRETPHGLDSLAGGAEPSSFLGTNVRCIWILSLSCSFWRLLTRVAGDEGTASTCSYTCASRHPYHPNALPGAPDERNDASGLLDCT